MLNKNRGLELQMMAGGIELATARQIKERMGEEKDPLQYLDGELARCIGLLGDRCEDIQDTISIYKQRPDEIDQFDLQKVKEELKNIGELYFEISLYLKVRKEQVKNQKRVGQLDKALARRQQWMEQTDKNAPKE
jgi:hypothetical protein